MSRVDFQRARRPDQKQLRRRTILSAADELLSGGGVDSVSLNAIAERAGLAKSNLYRYFESREEIFLQLLLDDWEASARTLEHELVKLAGSNDAASVARVLARLPADRPRLGQLVSVLSSVLEQNVSVELALQFKREVRGLGIRQTNALHAALPALPLSDCAAFGQILYALLAGFWPMAHPAAAVRTVLESPEFAGQIPRVPEDLEAAIHVLLVGFLTLRQQEEAPTLGQVKERGNP